MFYEIPQHFDLLKIALYIALISFNNLSRIFRDNNRPG